MVCSDFDSSDDSDSQIDQQQSYSLRSKKPTIKHVSKYAGIDPEQKTLQDPEPDPEPEKLLGRGYSVWSKELTEKLHARFGSFIRDESSDWPSNEILMFYHSNNMRK